jgi:hypothetical protein
MNFEEKYRSKRRKGSHVPGFLAGDYLLDDYDQVIQHRGARASIYRAVKGVGDAMHKAVGRYKSVSDEQKKSGATSR